MADIIQEQIDCSTAEEFLEAISPIGPHFKDQTTDGIWLFRGQWEDWRPIPSLFRKDENTKKKLQSLTKRNITSELIDVERDILISFFEIADKRGLTLPDDSQELRLHLNQWKHGDFIEFQAHSIQHAIKTFSIMALAQHYGMPTRFLDWTRQSFIAAFFASENAIKSDMKLDPGKQIVVWAFHFPQIRNQDSTRRLYAPAHLVTAPGASNVNLRAQHGVFTWLQPEYTNEKSGDYPTIHEMLQDLVKKEEYQDDISAQQFAHLCKFKKFALPQLESPKLLHLLAKLDITPSSVYPGYQSIVLDLQNQMRWK